ncbi:MAG: hypothetical protein KBT03_07190 [Bacteroidales bacterium]|nr:hypothetical protein [Candidatus Scybalousia scybalohippi]
MKVYCVNEWVEYFNNRDNDCFYYDPLWSMGSHIINGEVWYECYYKISDTLASDYDFSSRDLKEVFEYMQNCTGEIYYY